MSYILDALRKAEAERARGAVPGLEARPLPALPELPAPPRRRGAWGWLAAGVLGGAGLAAAAWWLAPARAPVGGTPATTAEPVPAATPGPPPMPAPASALAPAPSVSPMPSLPSARPNDVATPAPPVSAPAEPPIASALVVPRALPPAEPPKAATSPVAPATSPPPAAAARPVRVADLPAAQRQQLPPLKVGGSVWSETPASRFVMIDGQLLREGDTVAPGLVLERIDPRSARLRWRGQTLELGY